MSLPPSLGPSSAQNYQPVTTAHSIASATHSSLSIAPSHSTLAVQWPQSSASSTFSHDSFAVGLEVENPSDYDNREFDLETYEMELSSVVMQHEFENGRRFHKFRHGRYPLPNDDAEQERDALKHALLLEITSGHLFISPLPSPPSRIIDLGCGTGRWAIDVAEAFPAAAVLGVDLSPIMSEWLPPNVRFMVDDIEDEQWLHGGGFDLVYVRHVFGFLRSPETVLRHAFKALQGGGFIECVEFHGVLECADGSMPENHAPKQMMDVIGDGMRQFGSDWRVAKRLSGLLTAAGFENVVERTYKVPIGRWAKTQHHRLLGLYMKEILDALFDSIKARAVTRLGIPEDELDELVERAKEGLGDYRKHVCINLSLFSGQKPVV